MNEFRYEMPSPRIPALPTEEVSSAERLDGLKSKIIYMKILVIFLFSFIDRLHWCRFPCYVSEYTPMHF